MVGLSRYTHVYDLGNAVALYHSLRMKPVYLTKEKYQDLRGWLASPDYSTYAEAPSNISKEVQELIKYKILNDSQDYDDQVIKFIRSKIPQPVISVCYFITSEQCNLACKYCFLGNNSEKKRKEFSFQNMNKEVADKAIDFFVHQISLSGIKGDDNQPVAIFYGGEPLVNYPIVEYIAEKLNQLRKKVECIKNLDLSIVTNGLLLNRERALRLHELGVSIAISIDGFTEKENSMRVDTTGHPVFSRILQVLDMCKELNIPVSLSVTLTEETIKNKKDILQLIDKYDIKSFGFNILMSDENFTPSSQYNELAAQFIIDEFLELRKKGIYEDRIMRKLRAFTKSQIYFSDCAATSGSQIVVAPTGQVGICHGCLHDKKYFVTNVDDHNFDARKNPTFIEWSQLTPINKEECQDCPALGICGGGCAINAMHSKPGNTIHSIDERFCVHAKKTLEFLIRDLYRVIQGKN